MPRCLSALSELSRGSAGERFRFGQSSGRAGLSALQGDGVAGVSPKAPSGRPASIRPSAIVALLLALSLSTALLGACSAGGQAAGPLDSSAPAQAGSDEASKALDPQARAEIEQAFAAMRAAAYKNLTYEMETLTTATGRDEQGAVQQAVRTTMDGELRLGKKAAMHFSYESASSTQLAKTSYDMYVDEVHMIIKMGDKVYLNGAEGVTPQDYYSSITDVASEEEISQLLDVASSYRIEHGADTVITITADPAKVAETHLVDASSLPEGSEIATLVANYVISSDNHLKTMRIMSSTSGMPTYRVNQTYRFSKYDQTKMPEWPQVEEQEQQGPEIQTDEDGTLFVIDDDGTKYIIDSIDDDGTVHAHAEQESDETAGQGAIVSYDDPNAAAAAQAQQAAGQGSSGNSQGSSKGSKSSSTGLGKPQIAEGDTTEAVGLDEPQFYEGDLSELAGSTSTSTGQTDDSASASTDGDASGDQGRAYITASDGTIHYLDEPGSEIRDVGGSRVFIDANGEWYFLSEE